MSDESLQRQPFLEHQTISNPDSNTILTIICQLVGFLIANVTKTEQEWVEWGKPFLQIVFTSQFSESEGLKLFSDFEEQFHPLIGHGVALWIEETISAVHKSHDLRAANIKEGLEDYVIVTSMEDKLSKILAEYLLFPAKVIENTLTSFFTKFYQHLEQIDHYYDSRERSVARKVCSVLNLSAHQFSQLENELRIHSPSIDDESMFSSEQVPEGVKSYPIEENGLFLALFKQHSQTIPRESLLVSYRMWRVAFIAAGGGAMVGLAGFVAAPSIVSTVIPVLCNVGTFAQLSVTFDTFLSYVGVVTYPLIPSIFTTYGATVAGSVMMKRTAAIKDFDLLPLHIHHSKHQASTIYDAKDKTGIPIFILVNGHVEKAVDPRVMWGANGADVIISEQTIFTSTTARICEGKEVTEGDQILVEKKYEDHPDIGLVSSTFKELQADLLQESQLLAETIVHSLQTISTTTRSTTVQTKEANTSLKTESYEEISLPVIAIEEEEKEEDMHTWEELDYSYSQGWWKELVPYGEEYVLTWENDLLTHLTESFLSMIKQKISSKIVGQIKEFFYSQITPLHAIQKSIGLPNLALAKIRQLDDIWMIAMDRALQGGKLLAKILLKQYQPYLEAKNKNKNKKQKPGDPEKEEEEGSKKEARLRPITLIGYGMGARLIYHCLEALLEESRQEYGSEEAIKGIIENVVFIGAPVKIDLSTFQAFRKIVAARLINCYSRYDWILALLYRSKSYELLIAGLYPIYLPGQRFQAPKKANTTVTTAASKEMFFIEKVEVRENNDEKNTATNGKMLAIELQSAEDWMETTRKEKERWLKAQFQSMEEEVQGIENYDVTDIVYLQTDYPKVLPSIMKLINLQEI